MINDQYFYYRKKWTERNELALNLRRFGQATKTSIVVRFSVRKDS